MFYEIGAVCAIIIILRFVFSIIGNWGPPVILPKEKKHDYFSKD